MSHLNIKCSFDSRLLIIGDSYLDCGNEVVYTLKKTKSLLALYLTENYGVNALVRIPRLLKTEGMYAYRVP